MGCDLDFCVPMGSKNDEKETFKGQWIKLIEGPQYLKNHIYTLKVST